jgi:hypothetical protein
LQTNLIEETSMTRYCGSTFGAMALVVIAGCRGESGPKVTLRYHPPAGVTYHYALEQQTIIRVEGAPPPAGGASPEQAFTVRIYYTQRAKGPAQGGGGEAVTTTLDSSTLDAPGAGAVKPALDRMRGMRSDMVYDDRMQILSAAFAGVAGAPSPVAEQVGLNVKSIAVRLPEAPVGVGDSWVSEQEMPLGAPLNPGTPVKTRTKLTVRQILVVGADTSVLLGAETRFPRGQVSGGLMGAQVFSVSRGIPVRTTMGGTLRMRGTAVGRSEKTIAMNQRTSLRLVERK